MVDNYKHKAGTSVTSPNRYVIIYPYDWEPIPSPPPPTKWQKFWRVARTTLIVMAALIVLLFVISVIIIAIQAIGPIPTLFILMCGVLFGIVTGIAKAG